MTEGKRNHPGEFFGGLKIPRNKLPGIFDRKECVPNMIRSLTLLQAAADALAFAVQWRGWHRTLTCVGRWPIDGYFFRRCDPHVTTKESDLLSPARQEGKPPLMYASKIYEVEVNRFRGAYQKVRYSYDQPE